MIATVILSIFKTQTGRIIIYGLIALAGIGGIFAYLTHERRKAEKQAEIRREENERLERQNQGLEIIVNSSNSAAEVEKLKEKANAQSQNSNTSNADLFNSMQRDSNTFAGNSAGAKERFCRNFPADSKCR